MSLENGATYVIQNAKGRTLVDLNIATGDSEIHGYQWNDQSNQRWIAEEREPGYWVFKSAHNGRYLSLVDNDLRDDLRVCASESDHIRWRVEAQLTQGRTYRLLVGQTSFSLDLTNYGSSQNGTKIAIWGQWQADNQLWEFTKVS